MQKGCAQTQKAKASSPIAHRPSPIAHRTRVSFNRSTDRFEHKNRAVSNEYLDLLPETYSPTIVRGSEKTVESIVNQMRNLLPHQHTVLCTRVEENVFHKIKEELPECEYNSRGRTVSLRSSQSSRKPERLPGTVAIISGSSPDLRVAEECRIVCEHLGCYVYQLKDLKMSNLPHVLSFLPAIKAADVVIVVSGLDGALPSLLSGLVESPVIAVPTSAGQGATLSGVAPMLASICSSTPVSVVNIDDGKTGAMCAMRILRQSLKLHNKRMAAISPQATVQV